MNEAMKFRRVLRGFFGLLIWAVWFNFAFGIFECLSYWMTPIAVTIWSLFILGTALVILNTYGDPLPGNAP